ncbi:MAG: type I glyceraldehyde-3-phosphate dehydrogenase [Deltaproteobacteria bacterium]|nr:type I glyceraldehyde-3-phosphate dehydrogenase [Deltaproteobacteria bacterium]
MAVRIAINGFGRIGRNVFRIAHGRTDVEIVHINDLTSDEMLAYLLKHDSVHGPFKGDVKAVEGGIEVDGKLYPTSEIKNPAELPWAALDVDVVLECTGIFTDGTKAKAHLEAGAKKVVISAPGKNIDGTYVIGVNDHLVTGEEKMVSNASCTTNCLAPVVKVLHDLATIEDGLVTTIHSYTMDQNLLDGPHRKGDFRRARAAAVNMVPTSTGAAKAIGLVMPELKGKLDGMAMRVPTANVSIVDGVFRVSRDVTVEEVNQALRDAAASGPLKGILEASDEPLVSSDLMTNPHSSIADLALTQVMNGNMVKILSWYDNEWGFSNRILDLGILVTVKAQG